MATRRVRVWIAGRVQGVGFRASARERAEALGLAGWTRNLPDGRVEILAEGAAEAVAELLDWSRRGPPLARVEECRVVEETPVGEGGGFAVRRG